MSYGGKEKEERSREIATMGESGRENEVHFSSSRKYKLAL